MGASRQSYRQVMGDAGMGGVSAVVATLPAGYTLGEERQEEGIVYRLVYNASNSQIAPGFVMSPAGLYGPYSGTVTTASKTHAHIGAVVVHNATATTGTYFWGATKGYLASGLVADAVTLATGNAFYIALSGQVNGITTNSVGVSGNYIIGGVVQGPTAGTIAVRQGSVIINLG